MEKLLYKKYYIVLSLIFIFFPLWANDNPYSFADYLFHLKDYKRAALEYERGIFLSLNAQKKEYGIMKASESYYFSGNYNKSLELLKKNVNKDAHYHERSLWLIFFNLHAMRNFSQANILINQNEDQFNHSYLYSIYPEIMNTGNWENTERIQYWKDYARMNGIEEKEYISYSYKKESISVEIEKVYKEQKNIRFKKPWLGLSLSIIPGGGQAYSERYGDALSSFLVVGLTIGISSLAYYYKEPCTGAIIGGIGAAFYVGNLYGGYRAVKLYNQNMNMRKRKMIDKLIPAYQPLKP